MGELYDADILEWSEHQARLLRRLAEGQPSDEVPDWENIIEEVESVGRDQLTSVKSCLTRALLHDLKCAAWPQLPHVPDWIAQARAFCYDAADSYAPSMRQRIDLNGLYRRALNRMPPDVDG